MTLRLLIMNGFKHSDPELTKFIQAIYKDNPLLFQNMMPNSEIESLAADDASKNEAELENDDEQSVLPEADDVHLRPSAIGCIPVQHVRTILGFPLRQLQMEKDFTAAFSKSYSRDYNKPHVDHFGKVPLQWSKKVSFTHRYVLAALSLVFDFRTLCDAFVFLVQLCRPIPFSSAGDVFKSLLPLA